MSLINDSIGVLTDAKVFLKQITREQYNLPVAIMSDSTIGQHTRHFIEFYQCLLVQAPHQHINYCLRKRDAKIEQTPQVAIAAIDDILPKLNQLSLNTGIKLQTQKEGGNILESTIARELHYNVEHCIHHLALIRVALNVVAIDLSLPNSFGLAPSTIQHRKLAIHP